MNFVPLISTCKCEACGAEGSCAKNELGSQICRNCDPDNWHRAAEAEKNMWLESEIDASGNV